jgi:hypothetical protein
MGFINKATSMGLPIAKRYVRTDYFLNICYAKCFSYAGAPTAANRRRANILCGIVSTTTREND